MEINLKSLRARKARLAAKIGHIGERILWATSVSLGILGVYFWLQDLQRISCFLLAFGVLMLVMALWYRFDLSRLEADSKSGKLEDFLEQNLLASLKPDGHLSPRAAWQAASHQWQARFIANHLLLGDDLRQTLSDEPSEMPIVWQKALELAQANQSPQIDSGTLATALVVTSKNAQDYVAKHNLKEDDILQVHAWLERLSGYLNQPRPYFGGIGRDWASGFTPTLDRFGQNISRAVEHGEGHFHTLAHDDVLDSVIHNLTQGSGAVNLVGDAGTGKTSLVYALAQRLLKGQDESLLYYQIVSLNASMILSASAEKLERMMLSLFGEAIHAGNIIIFLDDAKLFFGGGTGAFDISQILLPVLQNRRVKLITAMTNHDYQKIKTDNEALISQMAVVNVKEPPEAVTVKILEDAALTSEQRDGVLITYPAIKEAYKLSGQYEQELAYPGKAINLLEQSIPYIQDKVMVAESVQQAVEKMRGVKVSKAKSAEAGVLLHLEDMIHKRMINQERAVSVVSAALRRGRAGVSNPNRPIGSFLFLGPTGVGKTELARSLAATYFGDEAQMVRLDMSEYQRPDDVARLLDPGTEKSGSLIMSLRQQPFSVVLLDEIEKAHPNVLNLLLQMLDEGQLTDQNGRPASFKNAIIITTSNAGSAEISQRVAAGETLEKMEKPLIDQLIAQGLFKPELINRFDEVVLFRPLNEKELLSVAKLMLDGVNKTLASQNVSVKLTEAALTEVVKAGWDPQFGARPMRRAIQQKVEDAVAKKLLSEEANAGTVIELDVKDLA